MKKILIMASVVIASIVANAASVKWTAANIYGPDGTTKWSGDVNLYGYLTSATADDAVLVKTLTASAAGAINSTFDSDVLAAGKDYNLFFTIESDGKLFTSDTKGPFSMQPTGTTTVGFGNMTSATQNASNWAAVPEPTSGLLMLLGMAGLALRRRHA